MYKIGDHIIIDTITGSNGRITTKSVEGVIESFQDCEVESCLNCCARGDRRDRLVSIRDPLGARRVFCPDRRTYTYYRKARYACKVNKISEI